MKWLRRAGFSVLILIGLLLGLGGAFAAIAPFRLWVVHTAADIALPADMTLRLERFDPFGEIEVGGLHIAGPGLEVDIERIGVRLDWGARVADIAVSDGRVALGQGLTSQAKPKEGGGGLPDSLPLRLASIENLTIENRLMGRSDKVQIARLSARTQAPYELAADIRINDEWHFAGQGNVSPAAASQILFSLSGPDPMALLLPDVMPQGARRRIELVAGRADAQSDWTASIASPAEKRTWLDATVAPDLTRVRLDARVPTPSGDLTLDLALNDIAADMARMGEAKAAARVKLDHPALLVRYEGQAAASGTEGPLSIALTDVKALLGALGAVLPALRGATDKVPRLQPVLLTGRVAASGDRAALSEGVLSLGAQKLALNGQAEWRDGLAAEMALTGERIIPGLVVAQARSAPTLEDIRLSLALRDGALEAGFGVALPDQAVSLDLDVAGALAAGDLTLNGSVTQDGVPFTVRGAVALAGPDGTRLSLTGGQDGLDFTLGLRMGEGLEADFLATLQPEWLQARQLAPGFAEVLKGEPLSSEFHLIGGPGPDGFGITLDRGRIWFAEESVRLRNLSYRGPGECAAGIEEIVWRSFALTLCMRQLGDGPDGQLDGQLTLSQGDLGDLDRLMPEPKQFRGRIAADLTVAGSKAEPLLDGVLAVNQVQLPVPLPAQQANLDGEIRLASSPGLYQLRGKIDTDLFGPVALQGDMVKDATGFMLDGLVDLEALARLDVDGNVTTDSGFKLTVGLDAKQTSQWLSVLQLGVVPFDDGGAAGRFSIFKTPSAPGVGFNGQLVMRDFQLPGVEGRRDLVTRLSGRRSEGDLFFQGETRVRGLPTLRLEQDSRKARTIKLTSSPFDLKDLADLGLPVDEMGLSGTIQFDGDFDPAAAEAVLRLDPGVITLAPPDGGLLVLKAPVIRYKGVSANSFKASFGADIQDVPLRMEAQVTDNKPMRVDMTVPPVPFANLRPYLTGLPLSQKVRRHLIRTMRRGRVAGIDLVAVCPQPDTALTDCVETLPVTASMALTDVSMPPFEARPGLVLPGLASKQAELFVRDGRVGVSAPAVVVSGGRSRVSLDASFQPDMAAEAAQLVAGGKVTLKGQIYMTDIGPIIEGLDIPLTIEDGLFDGTFIADIDGATGTLTADGGMAVRDFIMSHPSVGQIRIEAPQVSLSDHGTATFEQPAQASWEGGRVALGGRLMVTEDFRFVPDIQIDGEVRPDIMLARQGIQGPALSGALKLDGDVRFGADQENYELRLTADATGLSAAVGEEGEALSFRKAAGTPLAASLMVTGAPDTRWQLSLSEAQAADWRASQAFKGEVDGPGVVGNFNFPAITFQHVASFMPGLRKFDLSGGVSLSGALERDKVRLISEFQSIAVGNQADAPQLNGRTVVTIPFSGDTPVARTRLVFDLKNPQVAEPVSADLTAELGETVTLLGDLRVPVFDAAYRPDWAAQATPDTPDAPIQEIKEAPAEEQSLVAAVGRLDEILKQSVALPKGADVDIAIHVDDIFLGENRTRSVPGRGNIRFSDQGGDIRLSFGQESDPASLDLKIGLQERTGAPYAVTRVNARGLPGSILAPYQNRIVPQGAFALDADLEGPLGLGLSAFRGRFNLASRGLGIRTPKLFSLALSGISGGEALSKQMSKANSVTTLDAFDINATLRQGRADLSPLYVDALVFELYLSADLDLPTGKLDGFITAQPFPNTTARLNRVPIVRLIAQKFSQVGRRLGGTLDDPKITKVDDHRNSDLSRRIQQASDASDSD